MIFEQAQILNMFMPKWKHLIYLQVMCGMLFENLHSNLPLCNILAIEQDYLFDTPPWSYQFFVNSTYWWNVQNATPNESRNNLLLATFLMFLLSTLNTFPTFLELPIDWEVAKV